MLSENDIEFLRQLMLLANDQGYVSYNKHDLDRSRVYALDKSEHIQQLTGGILVLPKGEDAVLAFDKRQDEQHRQASENAAKEKQQNSERIIDERKKRRHDYLVAAFSAVIGAFVTLLVEHFDGLVAFVKQML